ncbi:hypothetical protein SAMN04488020_101376 [Palleronia marisminoris]|uniref:PepSY domain-containing protein n=1 Tax=Palleronia marisminoris TaxID=315423 RepID=A0A1Y5RG40_9RHOB|nr:hypothetical protein [Palleronia marisminoris]SFG16700.1 hypothetical protein SAMN04488020_101376 [Palleronia marisminoris]SLN16420.1 hypothetical protein PAM7066_00376 [Palleronia marisminoris]
MRFVIPLAALCLTAAVLGYRLGAARPEEGDALARAAAIYVSEVPGTETRNCAARPGEGQVWLIVACGLPETPERRVYALDRAGELIAPPGI